jgi:mannose-6-phosphate isomerase-like protein (cupin superfamily)
VQGFDVAAAAARLAGQSGGYEVVHESPGLEIGVYVLVAPAPDRQTPHAFDDVYAVLEGEGDIKVEGERRRVTKGEAVFVAAEADHRFSGYESLTLLVIFNGRHSASKQRSATRSRSRCISRLANRGRRRRQAAQQTRPTP